MHSEKLQILEEVLGGFYRSNDEYLFFCPFCKHHKRKLSVNIAKNKYKCWICDSHGKNIHYLIKRFGERVHKQQWNEFDNRFVVSDFDELFSKKEIVEHKQVIKLPDEYICLANSPLPRDSISALNYLSNRGVSKEDILYWKIGYCSDGLYRNRIIIPSFNNDGYCSYFIARSYTEDWMKYKNPPVSKNIVFNELMVDWNKPITLVEGIFDAIKADNAIPLLGSTLNVHSQLFRAILSRVKRIYIGLDQDAEKKALRIINTLISHNIEVYKIDTSSYEDIGEMTKKEFLERKKEAILMDSNSILMHKILQI